MMKYVYYYLWLFFAWLFFAANYAFSPIEKAISRLLKFDDAARLKREKMFNKMFIDFPGGVIDWVAFGALLGIIFAALILTVVYGDIKTVIFESRNFLTAFFIFISCIVYYVIYVRCIVWLKTEINQSGIKNRFK